jgi:hypothetical protein
MWIWNGLNKYLLGTKQKFFVSIMRNRRNYARIMPICLKTYTFGKIVMKKALLQNRYQNLEQNFLMDSQ